MVVRSNRVGDAPEAVSPQPPGEGSLDFPDQTRPAVNQRRIKLDQRCPGPNLGIRIRSAGDTAASDDRQFSTGQSEEGGENPGRGFEQGRPAETTRLKGAWAP